MSLIYVIEDDGNRLLARVQGVAEAALIRELNRREYDLNGFEAMAPIYVVRIHVGEEWAGKRFSEIDAKVDLTAARQATPAYFKAHPKHDEESLDELMRALILAEEQVKKLNLVQVSSWLARRKATLHTTDGGDVYWGYYPGREREFLDTLLRMKQELGADDWDVQQGAHIVRPYIQTFMGEEVMEDFYHHFPWTRPAGNRATRRAAVAKVRVRH